MPCGCSCLPHMSPLCVFLDPTQSCSKDGKGGLVGEAQPGTAGPWAMGWWSRVRIEFDISGQHELPCPPQGQRMGASPCTWQLSLSALPPLAGAYLLSEKADVG